MRSGTPSEQLYQKLHALYRELSGRDEAYIQFSTDHAWSEWCKLLKHRPEWQPENLLRLVISYRQSEISSGRRHPASLAFRNVIRDIAQADDLIADALAARRNAQKARMPAGKVEALKATGRPVEITQPDAKPAGEVLDSAVERLKLSQQLKDWKSKNL